MTKLEEAAREVLQWLDTGGHTLIPLNARMSYAEQYAAAIRAALAEPAAEQDELTDEQTFDTALDWVHALQDELVSVMAERDALLADAMLYRELIMAVSRKWPNETRHETALRYIRQSELDTAAASNPAPSKAR